MAEPVTKTICLENILQDSQVCSNPIIKWKAQSCVATPCTSEDKKCATIEVIPGCDNACVTVTIDCEDCDKCDPQVHTICLCTDSDDCTGPCEYCNSQGICVTSCSPGQVCNTDDETCVSCLEAGDCPCNQQCIQGKCVCPSSKPLKRVDGCCTECLGEENCELCEACVGDECVPKVCPDGNCDPTTGDCEECYKGEQCTGPNECCIGKECRCCKGYIRNPATGQCEEEPECYSVDDCAECEDCKVGECVDRICPGGQICVDDDCNPGCDGGGDCPPGQGCINGTCISCDELSCNPASGLQCEFASGCDCINGECEAIDCDPDDVSLTWMTVPGTPGTIITPGLPALSGSYSITPTGIIAVSGTNGLYQNHQFSFTINNSTSGNGTWTLMNSPTSSTSLGSGLNKSFSLQSTGPNLFGFIVKFTESSTGRVIQFGVYRDPSAELVAAHNSPNPVWFVDQQAFGTTGTTTGGTPTTIKLCSNNANFQIQSVQTVSTTGTINIGFSNAIGNCLTASISGCGTWLGNAIVKCGDVNLPPIPVEYTVDPANCCDPTDPNCTGGQPGIPCTGINIQNIPLIAHPTYGYNSGGDGEFQIIPDFSSAGLNFFDFFALNISSGCWSTSPHPSTTIVSDLAISTQGPIGGLNPSPFTVFATMGDGGCVRLGHTCELRISGCRKLQGEVCLDECTNFSVYLYQTGENSYKAVTSLNDEPPFIFTFSTNQGILQGPSGINTITIAPDANISFIRVDASYGTPTKCTAFDIITKTFSVTGCTDPTATNYNPAANVDDGSCVYTDIDYDCVSGLILDPVPSSSLAYTINNLPVNNGHTLAPGNYTVKVSVSGGTPINVPLTVPPCWNCSSGNNCVATISGSGQYNSQTECEELCGLCSDFSPGISFDCEGNDGEIIINPSGASGNYLYTVVGTDNGYFSNGSITEGNPVTLGALCNGNYEITVSDSSGNCSFSQGFGNTCFTCGTNLLFLAVSAKFDYCTSPSPSQKLIVTITDGNTTSCDNDYSLVVNGPGGASYNVNLPDFTLGLFNHEVNLPNLPDGIYTAVVTDSNGCTDSSQFILNCDNEPPTTCSTSCTEMSTSLAGGGIATLTTTVTQVNGSANVNWSLYKSVGGSPTGVGTCSGQTFENSPIASGTGTVGNLAINVPLPISNTCYRIDICDSLDPACCTSCYGYVAGSVTPPSCVVNSATVGYDEGADTLVLNWDFDNTLGGTVRVIVEELDDCVLPHTVIDSYASGVLPENFSNFLVPGSAGFSASGVDRYFLVTIEDAVDDTNCSTILACFTLDGVAPECSSPVNCYVSEFPAFDSTVSGLIQGIYALDDDGDEYLIPLANYPYDEDGAGTPEELGALETDLQAYANTNCGVGTLTIVDAGPGVGDDFMTIRVVDSPLVFTRVEILTSGMGIQSYDFTELADCDFCDTADPVVMRWPDHATEVQFLVLNGSTLVNSGDNLDVSSSGDRDEIRDRILTYLEPFGGADVEVNAISGGYEIVIGGNIAVTESIAGDSAVIKLDPSAGSSFGGYFVPSAGCGFTCNRASVSINLDSVTGLAECTSPVVTVINAFYVGEDLAALGNYPYDLTDAGDRTQLATDINTYLGANSYAGTAAVNYDGGGNTVQIVVSATDAPISGIDIACSDVPATTKYQSGTSCAA